MDIRKPNERLRIPIGIDVKTKNWDSKKQSVKMADNNAFLVNTKLNKISNIIENYIHSTDKRFINIKDIANLVKAKDVQQDDIGNLILKFIPTYILKYNNIKSGQKYKVLGNMIKKFNANLKFSDLSVKELEKFNTYLKECGYSNSYIVRNMKFIKTLIRGYSKLNPNYDIRFLDNYNNDISNKNKTLIALDENEINSIVEFQPNESKQKVKDLFIIQCFTGLRISDLLNLKKENIDKVNNEILLTTIKTSELIRIPITNRIIPLFEKYEYILPKISDGKYNKYIKDICKEAGIDSPTLVTSWRAGNRIDEIRPKYELISSHTARRTFITRLLRKGLLPEQIMKITGHRNRRSFDEYVKITQNEALDAVRNALD